MKHVGALDPCKEEDKRGWEGTQPAPFPVLALPGPAGSRCLRAASTPRYTRAWGLWRRGQLDKQLGAMGQALAGPGA